MSGKTPKRKQKSFRNVLRDLPPCPKCGSRMEPFEDCKAQDKNRCPGKHPL